MRYALLGLCVLIIIAGCFGARMLCVAIVSHGGICAGLGALAVLFTIGYAARDYLD